MFTGNIIKRIYFLGTSSLLIALACPSSAHPHHPPLTTHPPLSSACCRSVAPSNSSLADKAANPSDQDNLRNGQNQATKYAPTNKLLYIFSLANVGFNLL